MREALIGDIVGKVPDAHRRFLMSFKRGAAAARSALVAKHEAALRA